MSDGFSMTRLAPSPTGALHLGHARTFLITWWMARQAGAKIVMRMEDLDLGRRKVESVEQAYADLKWLGMDWDGGSGQGSEDGSQKEVVQSERLEIYAGALQTMWERGLVYPCTCTRADILANVAGSASAPHEAEGQVRYPGTCAGTVWDAAMRAQAVAEVAEHIRWATGKNVCWRLRVRGGVVGFEDRIAGAWGFDVEREAGDFPLTRFDGTPAYQLACVVDDHEMGIDCVIRGDDLLSSTARQLLIYEALGFAPPTFAHVPLVIGADGKRLAKRHGESRIAQFREQGVRAERIVGWAAWRSGMIGELREMTTAEALGLWDLRQLPRARIVLGQDDMGWLTIY